ncbi:unnamed protein product [Tilletia controversa]|uniref:Pyruvate decarboxylase n=3 Tax=Tilletia TaxID=13289 RepID=A0A8X7MYY5_9BASI|nr:hypothetical protein CF336_g1558 [Tilletia laevis]KAE8205121.1 hypothetical protein CF328_g679 [Tilletia controversa]KAE8264309.1 hypothetical protein A4X03_0g1033 [Tilletia caries]KAE8207715.1 hypothetical protein CF335_g952 [Tilletia laevis]KAE8254079.1 hypothetical protein A4X06_0g1077 [Tilletia controversa]
MSSQSQQQVSVGAYLIERLAQMGVELIQGVPGDFNMGFLDLITHSHKIRWVGNTNELNAAYSADGYSRAKKTLSAVVTTFGVGELSALNGVAGAMSERVPVVHIVGVPSTSAEGNHSLLHHTLGDGNYGSFEQMSSLISAAHTRLRANGSMDIPAEIDRVLQRAILKAQPVYISLPTEVVDSKISAERLSTPIDTSPAKTNEPAEAAALEEILKRISQAEDPIVIVDVCSIRHFVLDEVRELVEKSGLTFVHTPMGKTALDEQHPQYAGVYVGSISEPSIKERVEQADLLLMIGSVMSDFNTGAFTYRTPQERRIELHSEYTSISFARFEGVGMKSLLPKLSAALAKDHDRRLEATKKTLPAFANVLPSREEEGEFGGPNGDLISQAYLWPRIGLSFLRAGDYVVVETGTSSFGSVEIRFPSDTTYVTQVLWGSIGWSVPCTLGVALAARELKKKHRVALFVGDGSLQLTVQELSTMIREDLCPYIFVLSNDGYEIERQIHGPKARYNNVAPWNHEALLQSFSAYDQNKSSYGLEKSDAKLSHAEDPPFSKTQYYGVSTKAELEKLLGDEEFNKPDRLRLIEMFMPRGDAPRALKRQAEATAKLNTYEN